MLQISRESTCTWPLRAVKVDVRLRVLTGGCVPALVRQRTLTENAVQQWLMICVPTLRQRMLTDNPALVRQRSLTENSEQLGLMVQLGLLIRVPALRQRMLTDNPAQLRQCSLIALLYLLP